MRQRATIFTNRSGFEEGGHPNDGLPSSSTNFSVRVSAEAPENSIAASLIEDLDQASVAHMPEWLTVVKQAYGHSSVHLQASSNQGHRGLLSAILIRSRLFGTVLSSMPFLDAGGPLSSSNDLAVHLVEHLLREAARLGADWVELRCRDQLPLPVLPLQSKVNLVLPLAPDADHLWREFDPKVRNQIRKAERGGLSVEIGGRELLNEFYDVFAVNMRDLGSPVHSKGFFEATLNCFQAQVAVVRKGAVPVGGLVALRFKKCLIVPWASSLRAYRPSCPNMILYWEVIRRACTEGLKRFEFGRSSRGSGTYQFKRQWGATEEPLFWYSIPLGPAGRRPLWGDGRQRTRLVQLWQRLPVRLTRWIGPPIRKYLTQ